MLMFIMTIVTSITATIYFSVIVLSVLKDAMVLKTKEMYLIAQMTDWPYTLGSCSRLYLFCLWLL